MDNSMTTTPAGFIGESIEVEYDSLQVKEKTPTCPNRFLWRGERFEVRRLLEEWSDFSRRGRMSRNMQPQHATRASRVGSWGVGKFYFRVEVQTGQIFEIYYDRAPEDVDDRKGNWFLKGERKAQPVV
jgi:hypothetical protein